MSEFEVAIKIAGKLDKSLQTSVSSAQKMLGSLGKGGLSSSLTGIGNAMESTGKALTTGVTMPVIALGATSVKEFGSVDKSMKLVQATMGSTDAQAKQLESTMKKAAANSVFGMQDAADATLNFARQGFNAKQAGDMLTPALNLAAGTATDLSVVTGGLGNALKMFGKDNFRVYDSMEEGVKGYFEFIQKPRYKNLKGVTDAKKYLQLIKADGYATASNYVESAYRLITQHELTEYDVEGGTNMKINIIKQTGTHGLYSTGRGKDKYLVYHYTAGVTSKKGSARATASWFANPKAGGTADFIVDDEEIVQYNPDPEKYSCWAVGGSAYGNKGGKLHGVATNHNCISIEICSTNKTGRVTNPNDDNWYFTDAALANAAKLGQYLMEVYGIPASRVIRHYDVTGKLCPGIKGWNLENGSDDKKWQTFKAQLSAEAEDNTPAPAPVPAPSGATTVNYAYKVTVSDLNIRKGPGTNYDSAGYTGKGVFTIVAEKGGWGKLKSGAGWISLNSKYGHKVSSGSTAPAAAPSKLKWTVTISDLRIRKGPGTNYDWTGAYTGKGTFTIVEKKNGWGRLKSGAGWISLNTAYGHKA